MELDAGVGGAVPGGDHPEVVGLLGEGGHGMVRDGDGAVLDLGDDRGDEVGFLDRLRRNRRHVPCLRGESFYCSNGKSSPGHLITNFRYPFTFEILEMGLEAPGMSMRGF